MPDKIQSNRKLNATAPMAVAPHAVNRMIQALQFKPSNMEAGGWDGGWTHGSNVRSFTRSNIGIIEINDVLLTHDNVQAYCQCLTTYESLALEISRMIEDESIDGVILSIDSPGGNVAGVNELSDFIFQARGLLPLGIYTHAMGEIASASYIIGCAATAVILDPTAIAGSVGAVMGVWKEDPEDPIMEFVSSISPLKRADPEKKEGAEEYQSTVDAIGDLVVVLVARNRGTSVEKVISDFGQGGELVGQQAVDAGMADSLGSLEQVITAMRSATVSGTAQTQEESMSLLSKKTTATATAPAPQAPAATAAPAPEAAPAPAPVATSDDAVQAERSRVSGIVEALQGTGLESKTGEYIAAGATVDQVNGEIVAHLKANPITAATPVPATPAPAAPAAAENLTTLESMKSESEPAKKIEAGNGGDLDDEKTAAMKAVKAGFAQGAKNAIANHSGKQKEV